MKKIILLLSTFLLITTISFSQVDKRFRNLTIHNNADFYGITTFNGLVDFNSNAGSQPIETLIGSYTQTNQTSTTMRFSENLEGIVFAADLVKVTYVSTGSGDAYYVSSVYWDGENSWTTVTLDGTIPATIASNTFYRHSTRKFGIGTTSPEEALDITFKYGISLKSFYSGPITGWIMNNADGEDCYVYPNAAGNALIISLSKP